jgi:hypothetical protein
MTEHVDEDGQLKPALAAFRAAVADLCDQTPTLHHSSLIRADSLYWQLQCAVGGANPAAGSGTSKSRPPIWTDALDLKNDIDTGVSQWCSGTNTPAKLNWLTNAKYRPQDTSLLEKRTAAITDWCDRIEKLFNPPHVKHISAPCPACNATHAYRRDPDEHDKHIRVPALQVIAEHGCTCTVCHATWPPYLYLHLCRLLGFELPPGMALHDMP